MVNATAAGAAASARQAALAPSPTDVVRFSESGPWITGLDRESTPWQEWQRGRCSLALVVHAALAHNMPECSRRGLSIAHSQIFSDPHS